MQIREERAEAAAENAANEEAANEAKQSADLKKPGSSGQQI